MQLRLKLIVKTKKQKTYKMFPCLTTCLAEKDMRMLNDIDVTLA